MRLLFLSASGGLGGAERVLLEAVAALRQLHRDWALRVICLGDGPLAKDLDARGAEVRVLPLPDRFAALGESGRSAPSTVAALGIVGAIDVIACAPVVYLFARSRVVAGAVITIAAIAAAIVTLIATS